MSRSPSLTLRKTTNDRIVYNYDDLRICPYCKKYEFVVNENTHNKKEHMKHCQSRPEPNNYLMQTFLSRSSSSSSSAASASASPINSPRNSPIAKAKFIYNHPNSPSRIAGDIQELSINE